MFTYLHHAENTSIAAISIAEAAISRFQAMIVYTNLRAPGSPEKHLQETTRWNVLDEAEQAGLMITNGIG